MKRTYTMVEDGQQGQQGKGTLSRQGVRGDTELAHVNPWEQALLRALGGAGTTNPQTGLRQFYTDYTADITSPYSGYIQGFGGPQQYASAIMGKQAKGIPLVDPTAAGRFFTDYPQYFTTPAEPPPFFNFPLDIKPHTERTESSYAGLPGGYGQSLLQSLMPQLQTSIADMPGNIDRYTGQALGGYQQMMQDALRRNIPVAIDNLANRGIISSTEDMKIGRAHV